MDDKCVDPPPIPVTSALACDEAVVQIYDRCLTPESVWVCPEAATTSILHAGGVLGALQACVGMDAEESAVCENTCALTRLRAGFTAGTEGARIFGSQRESLLLVANPPYLNSPDGYGMLQHYRLRAGYWWTCTTSTTTRHTGIACCSPPTTWVPRVVSGSCAPLASVVGVDTKIVRPTDTTPAYSETTLSVRTECQLPDESTCLQSG